MDLIKKLGIGLALSGAIASTSIEALAQDSNEAADHQSIVENQEQSTSESLRFEYNLLGDESSSKIEKDIPDLGSILKKFDLRLYSDNSIAFESGERSSSNLAVLEYDRFKIGFERLDDAERMNYGFVLPIDKFFGIDGEFNVHGLRSEDEDGNAEHEFIGEVKPFRDLELDFVGRYLDLRDDEGFSLAVNYRQPGIFDEKSRFGAGIEFVSLNDDNQVGGYAWGKIPELNDLFIGAGMYSTENRFVIGMPNKGGLAWRYFRIDADDGFELNEFLFSTEGVNLSSIDFLSAMRGRADNITNSFIPGHVFRYVVPPPSARGRGWTGRVLHTRTPDGDDFLDSELVRYLDDKFFIGGGYRGQIEDYGTGQVTIPMGVRLGEDDGLTRNFLRLTPFYDLETDEVGLGINFEIKF